MILSPTFKRLCLVLSGCLLIGVLLGLLSSKLVVRQEYRIAAQMLGAVERIEPELADKLIQELKVSDAPDTGTYILQKYGYSPDTFWKRNLSTMIGSGVLLMLFLGASLGVREYVAAKKSKNRIDELTSYLKSVNLGRYSLLVRKEDAYSHLEDEIYKTVTGLRQSRVNAIRERQSLARNLADISHQLKTPITSMSLMTQLLAEQRTGEDAVYIEKLDRQLHRLNTLLSSLLTLSKLDAGTLEMKCERIHVGAMLTRAVEPVEDMLHEKKQSLLFIPDNDIRITGDISWLAEAFLNLIKNCCEHTPEGGTISVSYSQNPLYTEIVVEDNGSGFDMRDLPHLFERFYRGKHSLKDSIGIGLALSKSIIELQNGSVRAENAPKGGARFIAKIL
ncbi:HAMP domain-containing sensor histidine kinase [Paenibacillus sp. M1]|uniref:histidine kinase n=1 Tax=Paenibacillus haidiansis TaxID=1574488 RepID=A0ABU7VT89_9BACL